MKAFKFSLYMFFIGCTNPTAALIVNIVSGEELPKSQKKPHFCTRVKGFGHTVLGKKIKCLIGLEPIHNEEKLLHAHTSLNQFVNESSIQW